MKSGSGLPFPIFLNQALRPKTQQHPSLKLCPQLPYLREQHHVEHLAQVAYAAGALFKTDDAFYGGDVATPPTSWCAWQRLAQAMERMKMLIHIKNHSKLLNIHV
jgi:hypothetical protein